MPITTSEFDYVRDLVYRKSGIVLEPGKEYLVEARLTSVVRQEKLESIEALVKRLRASSVDPLHVRVVEAMTTNETSFFRDIHPFEALKKVVIPELLEKRAASKTLSIWCAAASTGQEPYTVAMCLLDAIPNIDQWRISFVATDISSEMIARCKAGRYNQIEINRGLPAMLMVKYFSKQGLEWEISPKLRSMVDFREMNLTQPFVGLGQVDIVFMRNVLIYFDAATKKRILANTRQLLRPDGSLFLGSAETTMGLDENYQRVPIDKSSIYRPAAASGITAKAA
ncbi:MAG: protein-glutamate O-methyltransferase CheR [Phycisphaerales bacterium]